MPWPRDAKAGAGELRGYRLIGVDADARPTARGCSILLCLWGVIWMACFAASLLGETEANWMVPGYISWSF